MKFKNIYSRVFSSLFFPFVFSAPIILTSCGEYKEVTGRGSSSVFPIIAKLSDNGIDIAYVVSGSGDGFNSQSGNTPKSDFGMMSSQKIPKQSKNGISYWKNNHIRTVTFAIDAIAIAINLPNGLKISNDERPILVASEIAKLFDVDKTNDPTWGQLLYNEEQGTIKLNSKPYILGRDGGKSKSGTADGFFHTLGKFAHGLKLDKNHELFSPEQKTKEPNSAAALALKSNDGSLTYLSLGYALNNEGNDLKVAKIKNKTMVWNPKLINNYGWKRPFNIAFDTRNKDAIEFTKKLLSMENQNIIKKLGYVKLTNSQLSNQTKMYKNVSISLTTTDLKINEITTKSGIAKPENLYFGVIL